MLWKKSWIDTRWRFFVGLSVLTCAAAAIVLTYPRALALVRTYDGYVLSQWYHQTPISVGSFFAILLGSGSLFSHGSSGGLFTLSLPVSRTRVLGTRAALGLGEWLVLATVPSLLLPLLSPSVGETYSLISVLAHAVCIFAGGSVFFCFALMLSTVFDGLSRPLLFTFALASVAMVVDVACNNGIYTVMSGARDHDTGQLPWAGLLLSVAGSAGLLWIASVNLARRDF